jgi:NAD(P)H dehydrogenase (quinone)
MTIVVTGATGHLGRFTVESLLERGVPAAEVVATGRSVDKLADLAARGVTVRHADYTDPASLKEAFAGADRVLLVSGSEMGKRVEQHRNAVAAARDAGVSLLVYTSAPKADDTALLLAAEHRETEAIVKASGVPYVLLRNSWYIENWTAQIGTQLEHGAVLGAAGEGRVSGAARRDYAEAAAAVLTSDGHEGATYELGGDVAFTLAEYAAEVTRQSGTTVVYTDLPVDAYTRTLIGFGLPEPVAAIIADSDAGIVRGDLLSDSGTLRRLIGRPTTSLAEAVGQALPA